MQSANGFRRTVIDNVLKAQEHLREAAGNFDQAHGVKPHLNNDGKRIDLMIGWCGQIAINMQERIDQSKAVKRIDD